MMTDNKYDEKVDVLSGDADLSRQDTFTVGQVDNADQLQRHLGNRQVQLIAIGGSIGTATFVSIANGLVKGGPGSLLLAYTIYTCMLGLVNNSMAEMASYMPVSGGFIRMAGHWVDESLGFWVGWNFFLYEVDSNVLADTEVILTNSGFPHPIRDLGIEPGLDVLE